MHLFITVILVLLVVAIVLWLINTYLPIDIAFKRIITILVILVTIIWLLKILIGFSIE